MTNKRECIDGISPQTTPNRIKNFKEWATSGKWRDFDKVTVQYTYLRRLWECEGQTAIEFHLSPMGMIKQLSAKLIHKKCYNALNVLPEAVREKLGLTADNFPEKKPFLKVSVDHEGSKGYGTFDHVYCKMCYQDILPTFIEQYI